MDSGYILNRRPFRDNSLIVDLFTKESGRITCVARVAKKRGKIMKGSLEPFRLLRLDWVGRGQMPTLTLVEERGRYRIQSAALCKALYLNELILKLVPQYAPAEDVFAGYQMALRLLSTGVSTGVTTSMPVAVDEMTLAECEIILLTALGYSFESTVDHRSGSHIEVHLSYLYSPLYGIRLFAPHLEGVPISGGLLIKLQQHSRLQPDEQQQLRLFLNRFIDVLLEGKKLNSRKLVFGSKSV